MFLGQGKELEMEEIIASIQDTFEKSAIISFRKYVAHNVAIKKFMIFSDYCIGDETKANDVFSFTIVPYDDWLDKQKGVIDNLSKSDIKEKRKIEDRLIEYLKENRLFHINFIVNERRGITRREDFDEKEVVSTMLENTGKMLDEWVLNTPSNAEYFRDIKKKLAVIKTEMQRKEPNFKIFRETLLLALLAGYICYVLVREAKPEIVGWFSDRDKMVDVYKGVTADFFHLNYHGLCEKNGMRSAASKICVGVPTADETGKMWYDELVRIPDHFAGTLADWDFENNTNTKSKFITMLEMVMADNDRCIIIKTTIEPNRYSSSRIVIERRS